MKKITDKNIDNYYQKTYLIGATTFIYILLTILKEMYYNMFGVSLNTLTNIEQQIATISYQIFAISLSLTFFIKHQKESLKKLKQYLKISSIGLATIIIYSLQSFLEIIILFIENINISNMSIVSRTIYLILFEIFIMSIIALLNHKKLEKNFKDFKKNWKDYLQKNLQYYILALIIMMVSSLVINSITNGIAGNEQSIRNTLEKAPVYMFFSAVIAAPFIEEMVFRQSIKNIIPDKLAFIITSGLIFGGLHVIGNINTIVDVLYIIPYATPGIAFAYILQKTDNIFIPMTIHFLHNGLLMTLQIILMLCLF